MISFLEDIDREILFSINGCHSEIADSLMWSISSKYFGIPFYLLILYLSYKKMGWKSTLLFVVGALACIGLADLTSKYLFKEMFERYRPSQNIELKNQLHYVNDYHGGIYGFVSSHAANMFAITSFAFLALKKHYSSYLLILFLFPIIVSYSRVYLGVHYPSDVVVGGIVGSLLGWVIYRILAKEIKPHSK